MTIYRSCKVFNASITVLIMCECGCARSRSQGQYIGVRMKCRFLIYNKLGLGRMFLKETQWYSNTCTASLLLSKLGEGVANFSRPHLRYVITKYLKTKWKESIFLFAQGLVQYHLPSWLNSSKLDSFNSEQCVCDAIVILFIILHFHLLVLIRHESHPLNLSNWYNWYMHLLVSYEGVYAITCLRNIEQWKKTFLFNISVIYYKLPNFFGGSFSTILQFSLRVVNQSIYIYSGTYFFRILAWT